MALTAGTLSLTSVTQNSVVAASTAASGGTGPYTEAWYISTTSGFTPGAGNIVAGASGLAATIAGLIPGTQYYVKVIYTDTGNSNATVTATQLAALTSIGSQAMNQFAMNQLLGQLDLPFSTNTYSAMVASSYTGSGIYAGQAVKLVAGTASVVPQVIPCAANSDSVFGFVNYNIKNVGFVAGQSLEISLAGNVMWLYATGAITQGAQVTLDVTTIGGVGQKVGSSGAAIVGWALDGAAAAGALIRIKIEGVPSFTFA